MRVIEYQGEEYEIEDYLPEHYWQNQEDCEIVAGWRIPINPNLRPDFDHTPNEERDYLEVEHWWGKPYVETVLNSHWPEGRRWDVRCLDGGAWDRSTNHGAFATLAEALAFIESRVGG